MYNFTPNLDGKPYIEPDVTGIYIIALILVLFLINILSFGIQGVFRERFTIKGIVFNTILSIGIFALSLPIYHHYQREDYFGLFQVADVNIDNADNTTKFTIKSADGVKQTYVDPDNNTIKKGNVVKITVSQLKDKKDAPSIKHSLNEDKATSALEQTYVKDVKVIN